MILEAQAMARLDYWIDQGLDADHVDERCISLERQKCLVMSQSHTHTEVK